MQRVLHIIGSLNIGGAEMLLMNLYRNIDRTRIQFDFLLYEKPVDKAFYEEVETLGAKIYYVPKKSESLYRNFYEIYCIVKENKYNIVWRHTDNCFAGLDLIIAQHAGASNCILHAHSSNVTGLTKYLHYFVREFVNRKVQVHLACGKDAGRWMYGNRAFEEFSNAIDIKKYLFSETIRDEYRMQFNIEDTLVLGHVGRIEEVKNQKFLIEIMKKLIYKNCNIQLFLIGNGSLLTEIENQIKNEQLEKHIICLGSRNDIAKLMQMFDVFLLPSIYEGFPMVLIEAQAAGLPVICSKNVPEEVNITGEVTFLPLEENTEKWEEEIIRILEKRTSKREQNLMMLNSKFDIQNQVREVEKIIIKV